MEANDWNSVSQKCNEQEKPLLLYINKREDVDADADLLLCNDVFQNFTHSAYNIFGVSQEQKEGQKIIKKMGFDKPPLYAIIVFPTA